MNNNGILIISLDFELLWGVFDVVELHKTENYFLNTRKVIPQILENFEKNGVNATWATVGMLFNENWEEWEFNQPNQLPHYQNSKLSAYSFGEKIKSKETEKYCFAPKVIQKINGTAGQELGTHTYSHYYCLETGPKKEDFQADLQMAVKVSKNVNSTLKSLVFPRNQIKEDYLDICRSLGLVNVRSNPSSWYWSDTQSETLSTKLARTGDAYFSLGKKSYSSEGLKVHENGLIEQKASRFLRPVENNFLLRKLKITRILSEMTYAAKNNQVYHLWWHPHNFGHKPEESLKDLKILIAHYLNLKNTYAFQSLTMQQLGESLSS